MDPLSGGVDQAWSARGAVLVCHHHRPGGGHCSARLRIAQEKSHLVAAEPDQIAVMQRRGFDPQAVYEGTGVAGQVLKGEVGSAALNLRMTRRNRGVTEQS